jgi:hypothetical protein
MTPTRTFVRSLKDQAVYLDNASLALVSLQLEQAIASRDGESIRFVMVDAVQQLYRQISKQFDAHHRLRLHRFIMKQASEDALILSRLATQGAEIIERLSEEPKAKPAKLTTLRVA